MKVEIYTRLQGIHLYHAKQCEGSWSAYEFPPFLPPKSNLGQERLKIAKWDSSSHCYLWRHTEKLSVQNLYDNNLALCSKEFQDW